METKTKTTTRTGYVTYIKRDHATTDAVGQPRWTVTWTDGNAETTRFFADDMDITTPVLLGKDARRMIDAAKHNNAYVYTTYCEITTDAYGNVTDLRPLSIAEVLEGLALAESVSLDNDAI